MSKIILVRHGDSQWDKENRFIGWTDVPLLEQRDALKHIGNVLLNNNTDIDLVVTSVLERSVVSAWTIMNSMYKSWIPEIHDWRLNPRHYGVIQGLTYQEALLKYPNINEINASWDKTANPILINDKSHPKYDRKYSNISPEHLPSVESLQNVYERVESSITEILLPVLMQNKNILIVAHRDSIRSILKYFQQLSNEYTINFNI
ncbi:MAG: 2,3-bisphosphoglycerate-dependent phosphoglycerate mutase, partial [Minisyncoccia bacterium]